MFVELYFKITNFICTVIVFSIHFIFKLCFGGNKKAKFYFNYFILYFSLILSGHLMIPALVVCWPKDPIFITHVTPFFRYLVEKIMEIKITVRNAEKFDHDIPSVVVQNHQSSIEVLVNICIWPIARRIISVSRKEIKYIFPLGIIYNLTCAILLSRNDGKKAYEELKSIGDVTKKTKSKVWMYPEGTRNRYNKETFLPFKKGAFFVAISSQLPIIPVIASPFYFIDYKNKTHDKGQIVLQILDPVPTTGLTVDDIPELLEKVRQLMLEEYKKLYEEFMPNATQEKKEKSALNTTIDN